MPSVQLVYSVTMLMCTAIKVWVFLGRICESPYFPVNYATPTWFLGQIHFADFQQHQPQSYLCSLKQW